MATSSQWPTGLMVKASVSGFSRERETLLAEDSGFESQVGRIFAAMRFAATDEENEWKMVFVAFSLLQY